MLFLGIYRRQKPHVVLEQQWGTMNKKVNLSELDAIWDSIDPVSSDVEEEDWEDELSAAHAAFDDLVDIEVSFYAKFYTKLKYMTEFV